MGTCRPGLSSETLSAGLSNYHDREDLVAAGQVKETRHRTIADEYLEFHAVHRSLHVAVDEHA